MTMIILDLVRLRPSFILLLLIALQSFNSQPINVDAQSDKFIKHRGEGLWGGIKNTVDPIHHSIKRKYNNLSNNGRFIAGGCVGFGVSRVIIRSKLFCFLKHMNNMQKKCATAKNKLSLAYIKSISI
jgi:hypothetical protein